MHNIHFLEVKNYIRSTWKYLQEKTCLLKFEVIEIKTFILRTIITGLSLFLVDWIVPGVTLSSVAAAFAAALILGLINAFIRPVLIFLTFPITVVTLGVFLLIINALTYWLTAAIVPGFDIDNFFSAVIGALITSIVGWGLNRMIQSGT